MKPTKQKKPDFWEVFYCCGAYLAKDGSDIYYFRGKRFSSILDAWRYATNVCWDIGVQHYRQRYVLISQNGGKPSVEAVVPDDSETHPYAHLEGVSWLPYSALLPPEYLTADGVRPLPWRSTLARLRKAVAKSPTNEQLIHCWKRYEKPYPPQP